jgi:hypothetical protein
MKVGVIWGAKIGLEGSRFDGKTSRDKPNYRHWVIVGYHEKNFRTANKILTFGVSIGNDYLVRE